MPGRLSGVVRIQNRLFANTDSAALYVSDLLFFVGLILEAIGIAFIARALTTSPCCFAVTVFLGYIYLNLWVAVFVALT